jgi:hypothetical protein
MPRPDPSRSQPLHRMRRLARWLGPLCLAGAVTLPLVVAVAVLRMPETEIASRVGLPAIALPALATGSRWSLVALGTVPASIFALGLLYARRVFQSFARGDFFARDAVVGLRGFAACASVAALAAVVVSAAASVVLTSALGPGHRRLAISLGSGELLQLLTAGLVWLISGALAEAQALADENAQFV